MHRRATTLTASRILSGRPLRTAGRLLDLSALAERAVDAPGDTAVTMPRFVLSTEREATDGHIVRQEWDVSRAEGVGIPVLWCHEPKRGVYGQWRGFRVVGTDMDRHLEAEPVMDVDLPEAAVYAGQIQRRMLRAVSVGWAPGACTRRGDLPTDHPWYLPPEDDECGMPAEGLVMGTPEAPNRLFECSLVPVPADDGAFAVERSFAAAERALGGRSGAPGLDLDAVLAAVAGHPSARAYIQRIIAREVEQQLSRGVTSTTRPGRKPGRITFTG